MTLQSAHKIILLRYKSSSTMLRRNIRRIHLMQYAMEYAVMSFM